MKRIAKQFTILFVSAMLAAPAAVCSQPRTMNLGPFQVTPSLGYRLNYSDNVFYAAADAQEDLYHQLTPGVRVDYASPRPGTYVNIGYTGDFAWYQDLTDNDWQRHQGFASLGYEAPAGFYFKVDENYTWSEDPFGTFNDYNQSSQFGLGEKTRRWDNNARLTLGYAFGRRWFAEGTYRNYRIRYDLWKDAWQDRIEDEAGAGLFYRITPRTSVFAYYANISTEYDRQNEGERDPNRGVNWSSDTSQDNRQERYWLGVRVDSGGKLDGELRVGYGSQAFDNARDANGRPYEDWDGVVAAGTVWYRPTTRSLLTLNLQHTPLGSPDAEAAMYVNTLVELSLRQELAHRFAARVAGQWSYDDYKYEPPGVPEKNFSRYRLVAGLDWTIRSWLTLGLEYAWEEKTASDEAYADSAYRANTGFVAVRVNY